MSYSPDSTVFIIAGVICQGYASGSFIKVKRNKETYSQKVGGHGDVVDVRSMDKTGTITITLLAASNTNDALSALLSADELAPYGTMNIPLMIKDNNGTTIVAGNGRIKGWPEVEVSDDEPHREWVFLVQNLQFFVGGHN